MLENLGSFDIFCLVCCAVAAVAALGVLVYPTLARLGRWLRSFGSGEQAKPFEELPIEKRMTFLAWKDHGAGIASVRYSGGNTVAPFLAHLCYVGERPPIVEPGQELHVVLTSMYDSSKYPNGKRLIYVFDVPPHDTAGKAARAALSQY